jgi:hypothetical protein
MKQVWVSRSGVVLPSSHRRVYAAKTDKTPKLVSMPALVYMAFLALAAANLRSRRFLEASAPASVSRTKSHHLKLLA